MRQRLAIYFKVADKTIAEVHRELIALLAGWTFPRRSMAPPTKSPTRSASPRTIVRAPGMPTRRGGCTGRSSARTAISPHSARSIAASRRPSQLFWGSFDLAVTRFSGRTAPPHPGGIPHLPDAVTREAYSHEVISAGFWPGGEVFDEAAFYAYAYPTPAGLAWSRTSWRRRSGAASLGEFLLPYASRARRAADPDADGAGFLHATFAAASAACSTGRDELGDRRRIRPIGHPPAP